MNHLKNKKDDALGALSLRRYFPVALVLSIGLVLSLVSFFVVRKGERELIKAEFARRGEMHAGAIQRRIQLNLEVLESIAGLYEASWEVSRMEFHTFVKGSLSHYEEIQALEWIPRVKDSERANYEAAARKEGFAGFQFTEEIASCQIKSAATRPEYFPVYYVEPVKGNEAALGFDLASNPTCLEALSEARDTGNMFSTSRIILVQETEGEYGFLIFRPIYRKGAPIQTRQERRDNLLGYALGVFRVGNLVEASLKEMAPGAVDIYFYDGTAPTQESLLYHHVSGDPKRARRSMGDTPEQGRTALYWQTTLDLPGRQWLLLFKPTPEFLSAHPVRRAREVLTVLLLFTGLLAGYLFSMIGRTAKIEDLWVELSTAYKELRKSEKKYRLLFDHANDAIFIVQDDVIKFSNPRTKKLLGYAEEEMDKTPFVTLMVHPDDRSMVLERYRKRLAGDKIENTFSFRIINRNGDELWVQLNTELTAWEEKPATLNFLRDITFQKRLEVQLFQAQKMEAIGTLAGGIAHDFNNLLMGIQGNASLMLLDLDSGNPHYRKLRNIEQYVQNGSELTQQLLGFARGGKYEVKPENINKIIEKTAGMFAQTKKEIKIKKKYQEDIWPVEVDAAQIEQVLLNLYVNGWQAMSNGGELYLQTENVMLDVTHGESYQVPPGRYVKISVTDAGIGMDEETRQRIFEPFFTTKERGRGTGLGLASVYGIIKNHGGSVSVYSEKGQGTTFTIYLPASEKAMIPPKALTKEVLKGSETVLLVDDEEMIIDVGREMLESLGYKVLPAGNGEEAVECFTRNRENIDLVILDMIMPDMGGGETFDLLKEIDPEVKVLLSSGYSIDGHAAKIMRRGCNGFIQKPFTLAYLSQKVRDVLEQ